MKSSSGIVFRNINILFQALYGYETEASGSPAENARLDIRLRNPVMSPPVAGNLSFLHQHIQYLMQLLTSLPFHTQEHGHIPCPHGFVILIAHKSDKCFFSIFQ